MFGLRKNVFFRIFSILLTLAVVGYMYPMSLKATMDIVAVKDSRDELKNKNEELKKKIQEIEGKVEDKEAYANTLKEQITVLQDQARLINENIESLNQEVKSLQKKIDTNERKVKDEVKQLQDMLADMYVTREELSTWQCLFSCKSIKEIMDTFPLIMIANKNKAEVVEQIDEENQQIQEDMKTCETKRSKVAEEKEAFESKNQELKEAQAKVQQVIQELNQDKSEAEHEVDINSAQIRALDAQEAEYYRQQLESSDPETPKQIATDQESSSDANSDSSSDAQSSAYESGYIWPTSCHIITSPFGEIDPIRNGRPHSGIDIGANSGSNIYASRSGRVITVIHSDEGYGNHVVIDHGDGYSTLYAHMSSTGVSEGEHVSQGQVIGQVGNTGNSYGAHLHFEVRIHEASNDFMPRRLDPQRFI